MADNQGISVAKIQQVLRGLEYPATKEDFVAKARENSADDDLIIDF